jgi:hypothetical protein
MLEHLIEEGLRDAQLVLGLTPLADIARDADDAFNTAVAPQDGRQGVVPPLQGPTQCGACAIEAGGPAGGGGSNGRAGGVAERLRPEACPIEPDQVRCRGGLEEPQARPVDEQQASLGVQHLDAVGAALQDGEEETLTDGLPSTPCRMGSAELARRLWQTVP